MGIRLTGRFRFILLMIASAFLGACGFHMRGVMPDFAQSIYLDGIGGRDPLTGEFGSALQLAGGKLASSPSQAGGIVHIYKAYHTRRSLTLSKFGRSTEFDLIYRIIFDVRTAQDEVILPRQDIEVRRDYFNDQTLPLAQTAEEGTMRLEMQKEAAQQLLRRAITALRQKPEQHS